MLRAHRWFTLPLALIAAGSSLTERLEIAARTTLVGTPNVVTNITGVERWEASRRYVLRGTVVIAPGASLELEAGTHVEAMAGASIVVRRGGRIDAQGTFLEPVVLSCRVEQKYPGCWDGLIVNGFAPINIGTPTSPAPGGGGTAGCLETSDDNGPFGGCEASDSSGVMRYVRVEYALNGIALRGVGSKTVFDNIEVLRTWGDGVSIVGGAVNVKHAIISASGDAGLAWRNGWVGRSQFLIVQQDPSNFRTALRGDNDAASPDATPRSAPQIYNATILAASSPLNPNDALPPRAIWLRNGTAGILKNLIVHRARIGLDVDGAASCLQLVSGALTIANTAFTGNVQIGDPDVDAAECSPLASPGVEQQVIEAWTNPNLVLTAQAQIDSVFIDGESLMLPDLRLRRGKPVSAGVNVATPPSDGFFDATARYYGAIAPPATDGAIPWYSGWTIGAPLSAATPGGTITGLVTQSGDGPLSGISVSSQTASATTDASGVYTLSVPSGYVTLSVTNTPTGCAAVAPVEVVVLPGQALTHDITLDCSPPPRIVAAGGRHTCFVQSGVWCWGANDFGAVGDGTTIERSVPLRLTGAPSIVQVAAGADHSCGITESGAAWCWGKNSNGQLGDGSTSDHPSPTLVQGGLAFIRVAAGDNHTCGLTATHAAYCWGSGASGQLGTGTTTSSLTPVAVSGGLTFLELVAGAAHTCGLALDGNAYCWGQNADGELGIGTTASQLVPTLVIGNLSFTDLGAGGSHTCGVVATSGEIYCWGANGAGQLGDGSTTSHSSPILISLSAGYRQVEAGTTHTCGVTTGNAVRCWGSNSLGQLGDGSLTNRLAPTPLAGSSSFREIDTGGDHTCGVTTSGEIACWGSDANGQVGQGGGDFRRVPTTVAGNLTLLSISSGVNHSCALTTAGAAYCWGRNAEGQLGDGSTTNRIAPSPIAGGHVFARISAGATHTCGVTTAGAAYCWGTGILGDGQPASSSTTPVLVTGGVTFASITVGQEHTCGLASDGSGYCWGSGSDGQLGNGSTVNRLVPTHVGGVTVVDNEIVVIVPIFASISAGAYHTCGITSQGVAYCSGRNLEGQLGDGTTTSTDIAKQVPTTFAFAAIDAGRQHTCALTPTGQGVCWGADPYGQLGDGTSGGSTLVPTVVAGTNTFSRITAGGDHTCAVTTSSAPLCWGDNQSSQLGDGTVTQRNEPSPVSGAGAYTSISAGESHSCGIVAGVAKCWGSNASHQIGDGLPTTVTTPVIVWNQSMAGAALRRPARRE